MNRVKAKAARLKKPRYALGLVVGVAYFGWMGWVGFGPRQGGPVQPGLPSLAETLLPVLLAVLAVGWWVSGRTYMALAFTPAESQFLFQAPIKREALLQYKLLGAQVSIVAVSIFGAVFFGAAIATPPLKGMPSLWLLFTTIHLHQVAAGLIRSSWTSQGRAGLRRQWIPMLVLGAAVLALVWTLWQLGAAFQVATSVAQFLAAVEIVLSHPAAVAVFLPFSIALGPAMAVGVTSWLVAMAGSLALMAAHYVWIVRIDAAFEEAAAEAGIELQEITTAFKEGRLGILQAGKNQRIKPPWFRLRPSGHPAVAIFWKGLTGFTRTTGLSQGVAITLLFFAFWTLLLFLDPDPQQAGIILMAVMFMLGGMSLFIGPLFLRNDLRTDLQRLDILKTLPLTGRDVVAAEILGSAASLTVVAGYCFTLAFVFFNLSTAQPFLEWQPWAAFGTTWLLLPFLCAVAMGIQNGLVLVFPAWMEYGPSKSQGIDQMGGMMVSMLLTGIMLVIAWLVPVLSGGTVAFRLFPLLGVYTAIPAALMAFAVLVGEVVLLVVVLGDVYDELDPSDEGPLR